MFVIINLIFYFGFDSSDESEDSIDFDDENQIDIVNAFASGADMTDLTTQVANKSEY